MHCRGRTALVLDIIDAQYVSLEKVPCLIGNSRCVYFIDCLYVVMINGQLGARYLGLPSPGLPIRPVSMCLCSVVGLFVSKFRSMRNGALGLSYVVRFVLLRTNGCCRSVVVRATIVASSYIRLRIGQVL